MKINYEQIKTVGDYVAVGVSGASVLQLIHVLLAIPAALYMCIRIYDWIKTRKVKH